MEKTAQDPDHPDVLQFRRELATWSQPVCQHLHFDSACDASNVTHLTRDKNGQPSTFLCANAAEEVGSNRPAPQYLVKI